MANNVYIGNRYVPVFANPVEWDNLREYEPLTIVTYQGTAYTSRKTVPVGTALSNTEYWVVTGNYNAQVEEYRQEVATLGDRVDVLEDDVAVIKSCDIHSFWHNKKVVIYGDSLSDYAGDSYWEYLVARDPSIQITNRAVSGSTIDQGRTAINSATDLDTYDIVVVAFGTNEWQSSWGYNSIRKRFETTFDILKTKIANNADEQVVVITPFYSYRNFGGIGTPCNLAGLTIEDIGDCIAEAANEYGYPVLNFYHSSSCNSSNYTYRLENSSGIYVHEIGDFSEELSYIVERWDGQSYMPRKWVFGENALSPIEFVTFTKRLTKTDFNTIPAGYRDGICMKVNTGTPHSAFNRYLSADEEYIVKGWGDHLVAVSLFDSNNTRVFGISFNANTEFRCRLKVATSGYYKIQINVDPNVSETIIGGFYFGRADGTEIPQDWHACNMLSGTASLSYKIDKDTLAFNSVAITGITTGIAIELPELSGIPDTFLQLTGVSSSTPTVTIGILGGNRINILKADIGTVYMCSGVYKVKCYNFDM